MNKRGMTTVVTSLILILIAIVVLSIVGVVVNNLIRDKSDQFITDQFTTDLVISNVQVLSETEMQVTVKRNPGEGNVVGIAFVAYDFNGSEVVRKNIPLKELEQKNFQIILEVVNASEIQKIAIAPIFGLDSGKELTGEIQYERKVGGEGRVISSGGSSGGGNGDSGGSEDSSDSSDESSEENGDTFPRIYWQYQGSEVTILNDIPYGSSINLVLEDSGLDPGTQGNFEIYDYDLVGGHDLLDTVTFFIGPEGNAFVNWIFEESVIDKARDLFEGNRLELYFVFLEIESEELDINFTGFIEENCFDGLQNQDETGVDCGGSICEPCLSQCQNCINGGGVWCEFPRLAGTEEDFCADSLTGCSSDTGRLAIPYSTNCPTCNDGIQNQDEEGIDCGGPNCPACPTCNDGIQNQGETEIDCGGPNCPACVECESGSDCPETDCVQGICQDCGPEVSGLGCSELYENWQSATCVSHNFPGSLNSLWRCRSSLVSYNSYYDFHHFLCPNSGDLCMDRYSDGKPGGDFIAEGICVPQGSLGFSPQCDNDEVAVDLSSSPPRYYSDCSEVGTPRDNEDLYCDSDVSSPTVGFNWDGICNCGACQTSSTNPCVENYDGLDINLMKSYLLERINWERAWLTNTTFDSCNFLDPLNCEFKVMDLPIIRSLDSELSEIARLHSQDMADKDYIVTTDQLANFYGSTNLEGLRPDQRIAAEGYSKSCPYPVGEVTDRIYVREGMDEYDVIDHLLYGGKGDTLGHWIDTDPWFGNLYKYFGEGPRHLESDYDKIYGNIFIYEIFVRSSYAYGDDALGIGFARDNKGRLYITVTECDMDSGSEEFEEAQIFNYHEDWRCTFNVNKPEWCDCNYNNDPRCYSYWKLLEAGISEYDMSTEQVALRRFCEGGIWDQDPELVCEGWDPLIEPIVYWKQGNRFVTGSMGTGNSPPITFTLGVQSPRLFEGDTYTFYIYEDDFIGRDYLGEVVGVANSYQIIEVDWTMGQNEIDAASNWGEGSTFELYFEVADLRSDILEIGFV
jgi:hypothetical protein